jgi:hypothetical protein
LLTVDGTLHKAQVIELYEDAVNRILTTMIPGIDSPYLNPVLRGILNGVVFCLSLLLLERSADVFVDSTNVVAKRFGLPTILVGLLTAGAEWEEVSLNNVHAFGHYRKRTHR